jgi:serine/threonine protein kinase
MVEFARPVLPRGQLLIDRYLISSVMGSGSYGVTYAGFDRTLRRDVAIKELLPQGSNRKGAEVVSPMPTPRWEYLCSLLRAEGAALASLDHPNVVRVFDAFDANATVYLVMELLVGRTLSEEVKRRGGRITDWPTLSAIAADVVSGLEAMHFVGLLHRDVTPSNVFLTASGTAKLIDFGAARSERSSNVTSLYTPDFAAPEQLASGLPIGPYTDVFGLGATIYRVASGTVPTSANARFMGATLSPLFDRAPSLPEHVCIGVDQALSLDPQLRPQTPKRLLELFAAPVVQTVPAVTAVHALSVPLASSTTLLPPSSDVEDEHAPGHETEREREREHGQDRSVVPNDSLTAVPNKRTIGPKMLLGGGALLLALAALAAAVLASTRDPKRTASCTAQVVTTEFWETGYNQAVTVGNSLSTPLVQPTIRLRVPKGQTFVKLFAIPNKFTASGQTVTFEIPQTIEPGQRLEVGGYSITGTGPQRPSASCVVNP